MSEDEVTRWIAGLVDGDPRAAEELWQRYYEKLVRLARRKMGEGSRRDADEEDIALSAFDSFCRGAAAGRFPRLDDRSDLWKLLVTITARKVSAQRRRSLRQKRGAGHVRGESVFVRAADEDDAAHGIDQVMGEDPTPEVAAIVGEECERLLAMLSDGSLRQIALLKLEGYSNEEIAERIECSPRTIERKLNRIRERWAGAAG